MARRRTKLKILVNEEMTGGFWAEIPELPGCMTEGKDLDELYASLKEAITGWLESDRIFKEKNSLVKTVSRKLTEMPITTLEMALI